MRYRLHVVRHAEGIHNPANDKSIRDPPLTPRGIEQSQILSQKFPCKEEIGLVITSPLRRTLQTALVGFQQMLNERYYPKAAKDGFPNGARLLIEPDIQAHSARPCDMGSEQAILQSEFPHLPWEELAFDPLFPAKEGLYATDKESLIQRGQRLQRLFEEQFAALAGSGRPDIVVVSHGGFMQFVVWDNKIAFDSAGWRSFWVEFDSCHNMSLVECG